MFQDKSLLVWLCSFSAVCIGLCALAQLPALGQNSDAAKAQIRALLEEKRNVLKERAEAFDFLVSSGRSTHDAALAARVDLLDAEIALTSDKSQRIKLLERKLATTKEGESATNLRLHNASVPPTEALMSTVRRLDAEVELIRERQ